MEEVEDEFDATHGFIIDVLYTWMEWQIFVKDNS